MTILEEDADGLLASVEGSLSNAYVVEIEWNHALEYCHLHASCTCGRFDDGFLCKHIAATILTLDAERRSDRVPGTGPLEILTLNPDENDYELDAAQELPKGAQAARLDQMFDAILPGNKKPKPKPKLPDWQKQLAEIRRAATQTVERPQGDAFAESLRVIYLLDLAETARRPGPLSRSISRAG